MVRVDVPIRVPTAMAWSLTAISTIAAFEGYRLHGRPVPALAGVPFTPGELQPWVIALGALATLSLGWLASLYAWPHRLIIDEGTHKLQWVRRGWFRRFEITGPIPEWGIRLDYYSPLDAEAQRFKRLTLLGNPPTSSDARGPEPTSSEGFPFGLIPIHSFLFSDVSQGERIVEALSDLRAKLAHYEVRIEIAQR